VRRAVVAALAVAAVLGGATYWLASRTEPLPDAGVSLELARERAARVSSLSYSVSMRVPGTPTEPVRGRVTARFALTDASSALAFDFSQPVDRLTSVVVDGEPVQVEVENGHVVVPSSALGRGENVVTFEFLAGDAPLNRHDDFLYSLFVPARASLAFPCFDQPDLKARWTLTIETPRGWTAASNTGIVEHLDGADHTRFTFAETAPLPPYLFAFVAGRFSEETAERDGRPFRILHRETDRERVTRNLDAILDLHAGALAWLEQYTGIAYPFDTFDLVLVPSFQFSGMEHPGAVYYSANALLLDESATQQQALARANVIAHETAHMWFGNLVTMRWFNDVWMKEVFANFMAAKIVNPSFPAMNHDLRFLLQHAPGAYDVDRTDGANPIRQPLANLADAGSLYGAIIYQKAPVVMRQLELLLGEDAFRDGLREYLAAYAYGNADWTDLVERLDRRTPADLAAWSRAWVEEPGRPTIRTDLRMEGGTIASLVLRQEDPRGRPIVWPARLRTLIQAGGRVHAVDVALDGREAVVAQAAGLPAPQWVLPDGRGLAYGFFDLDEGTRAYLVRELHALPDALTRGVAMVALWESMLEGDVAPSAVLRTLSAALTRETDELNLQQMLDYARTAFWRFTPPDDRPAASARLERVLRAGLARARTTSGRAAWFTALRGLAMTPQTVAWLEQVWRRRVTIPGLPLSELDEAELAADLAIREVPGARGILEGQLGRLTNPDRRARFAFVMPALSPDPADRDRFFETLRDPANRAREAWVLDAARYLHHPLRAAASRKHVRPALELVRDIQRTGDIFFPKRWADATLSGYQSVQTAAEVRAFIDELPGDYPPRLRWALVASADPLFRAARLQQRSEPAP
jgi:aminopeptidase N